MSDGQNRRIIQLALRSIERAMKPAASCRDPVLRGSFNASTPSNFMGFLKAPHASTGGLIVVYQFLVEQTHPASRAITWIRGAYG
jgi:hypothetical protein